MNLGQKFRTGVGHVQGLPFCCFEDHSGILNLPGSADNTVLMLLNFLGLKMQLKAIMGWNIKTTSTLHRQKPENISAILRLFLQM